MRGIRERLRHQPPGPARANREGGPEKTDKAIDFLTDKLAESDRKGCELIDEWTARGESKGTHFCCQESDARGRQASRGLTPRKPPNFWHPHQVRSANGQEPGFALLTSEPGQVRNLKTLGYSVSDLPGTVLARWRI